jgi:hypothetical protein
MDSKAFERSQMTLIQKNIAGKRMDTSRSTNTSSSPTISRLSCITLIVYEFQQHFHKEYQPFLILSKT